MSKTIWKFVLEFGDNPTAKMPEGAQIIHADIVSGAGVIYVWAIVDPAATLLTYEFILRGTGHQLPDYFGEHIATVLDTPFVWHLFRVSHVS